MKQQNFENHGRIVIGFHGLTFIAILTLLIGSVIALVKSSEASFYVASLLVLNAIILLVLSYYLRGFALKAQDRAIRSEEKFRYFILTGKAAPTGLSTRQFIGLRFASDDEFVALADRAVKEELTEKEIKKSIENWKADNYRV